MCRIISLFKVWLSIPYLSNIRIVYIYKGEKKMAKEKVKKPFYKKWWVWVLAIIIIGAANSGGKDSTDQVKESEKVTETNTEVAPATEEEKEETPEEKSARETKEAEEKAAAEAKAKEESIPREHKSALKKAEQYAETMNMSKAGIYDQLVSEHGENFPPEAAQYAIDNIVFDWKENALKKAQTYAESMAMSDAAIYDQLISEYGEKFTPEEAQYAIDNLK
jgi:flagellar biosynthesis GTPase FlhF